MRPLALALLLAAAAAAPAHAQSVTLSADATSAPYHSVIHLTATVTAIAGPVVFADNGTPIVTLPLSAQGTAVLGIATLAPGPHTLSASTAQATGNPVSITITPLPVALALDPGSVTAFAQAALNLSLAGLPARATGSVSWSDNANSLAATTLASTLAPTYRAFGDSITSGYTLANADETYASLFAQANGFTVQSNFAQPSAIACDLLAHYILPSQAVAGVLPTQDASPLFSVMIGSTDADHFGVPLGEPNFTTCHQAALAWLAIPREYKILPADAAVTLLSGAWQLPPAPSDSTFSTLFNSSGSGSALFHVTSNGGPLYLWYLLSDQFHGAFTVSLDGVPTRATPYTTNPDFPMQSFNNPASTGFALLRLPVAAGPHTLQVDMVSGIAGILAVATAPSPGAASVHPTVFVTDIPNQNPNGPAATPATIAQFSADALADVALLAADGLDIRPVPTHAFLTGDPAEFNDAAHPSVLGQQHLAAALQAAFASQPLTPFLVASAPTPTQTVTAGAPGPHTFTAAYSGDADYAPFTTSTVVDVVPSGQSVVSLSAGATSFPAASPISATATLFPPTPGALVNLMEGTQILATAPVAAPLATTAALSLAALAPGLHTIYAAYAGDQQNAASTSPPINVRVDQDTTTLALTLPAELPYPASPILGIGALPATATGTIAFTDSYTPNGQAIALPARAEGQATLANGTATLALAPDTPLAPGIHLLTAAYPGDPNDTAATASVTLTVDAIPTLTTLNATPAAVHQPSVFTATVTPAVANAPFPLSGNVTFTDSLSATPISVAILNGSATWTATTLTPGTHTITAAYAGDPNHASSVTPSLAAVIPRDPSTTILTASPAILTDASPVTFNATVSTGTSSAFTGSVLFAGSAPGVSGQVVFGQAVLQQAATAATATLTLPALTAGAYTVTATYSGDADTVPSASPAQSLQVNSAIATAALNAPATAVFGVGAALTVTVSPSAATGLVQLNDNGAVLASAALANGAAPFSSATLAPGIHTLTATYPGDSIFSPAKAAAVTLTIAPAPSATTLTLAQADVLAGSPALVNIRVSSPVDPAISAGPGGTVTLRSGTATLATARLANPAAGSAYATFSIPTATPGTYPLTASYSGDTGITASDTAAAYTVSPRVASGALTVSATQVPPMTPITLTAALTSPASGGPALVPTGTVTFLNGAAVLAVVPLDATGLATASMPSAPIGRYTLTATYTPTGVFAASPIAPQSITVTPPLAVAFAAPALTMSRASTANTSVLLTPLSGFQGAVAAQCITPHPYFTCTIDAPAAVSGPTTANVHLAVALTTTAQALQPPSRIPAATVTLALLLPLLTTRRRRRNGNALLVLCATAALASLCGCIQNGNVFEEVPPGTYVLQLTATAAGTPATASLTVTIQ